MFKIGELVGAMIVVCVIGAGATFLVCFIAGEVQHYGRKRMAKKKLILEKGFEHLKAREECVKRERRLAKERQALWTDDTLPIIPRQRVGTE